MIHLIYSLFDFVMHIDKYLDIMLQQYGSWVYGILALIIFGETGLVVTPFLPGDSLIFVVGALSARGSMNVFTIGLTLTCAALLGDNVNYQIGKFIGPKIFHNQNIKFLNKKYLDKTHAFYEKHGGKTVIIARFMPIIRTFSPFVAGIGAMSYIKFLCFSICGAFLWVTTFITGGYIFGNNKVVKENFTLVIFAIIFISVMPAVIGLINEKIKSKK